MTIDEVINDLKRLFSNYELDLPCTDSLDILSTTICMLEELKELRKIKQQLSEIKQQERNDAIEEYFKEINRNNLITNDNNLIIASMIAEQLKDKS